MDKRTIVAVVLSVVVISVGFLLQSRFAKDEPLPEPVAEESIVEAVPEESTPETETTGGEETAVAETTTTDETALPSQDYPIQTIYHETDFYTIEFSTAGGVITRLDLKEHLDDGTPVPMVLDGGNGVGTFNLAFGKIGKPYVTEPFAYDKGWDGDAQIHRFSRTFRANGTDFVLTKSYQITPGEYLILVDITLETLDGSPVPINDDGTLYTLTYGPQIGPSFTKLDNRYVYRKFQSLANDGRNGQAKRTDWKVKEELVTTKNVVTWAAIAGKYFAVIVSPGSGGPEIGYDNRPADGVDMAARLHIARAAKQSSLIEDTYRWYVGPKDPKMLDRYNDAAQNSLAESGLQLNQAMDSSRMLGWLQSILRFILELFYRLIPNYGVAIILLTVVIKAVTYPITHKSFESTSKMQAIQPKMTELREKYKGDTQRLNKEMSELYKREGVNPMSGCFPMLLQMPIMFALFGLLNRYFPLRGAVFIPGWITDLSSPESIVDFGRPILPFLQSFTAIRLLPILYMGSQLLYTKTTQSAQAGSQSGMQQKMMMYGMPIMFFFILYNMPAGLLLYWMTYNLLSLLQQVITNHLKKRREAGGQG